MNPVTKFSLSAALSAPTRWKIRFGGLFFFLFFLFVQGKVFAQNIGINATGANPSASALLDVDATGMTPKGLLMPRISLTSITDVSTIASPTNSLIVYNTNASMTNGNGVGYYYYCSTGCTPTGWQFMAAGVNGPGTSGQVLTSQGPTAQVQWTTPTIQSGGGGGTGCASCISETAMGTSGTLAACRNSCVAMGAGWRIPTLDEELYIFSGALGTPTGGWDASNYVWTSTVWDARIAGAPTNNPWAVVSESTGSWTYSGYTTASDCRCVK